MAFVASSDGTRLHFEVEGRGPAVLLHLGAGCDADLWRAAGYLPGLSSRYRCILFDHRGHGRSDRPTGAEANHVDRYVGDVIALLDQLGIERAAFWGYSNGIAVGLRLAAEHPTRVWGFVGSGTIAKPPPDDAQLAERVRQSIETLREHGWERMISGFEQEEAEPVPEWMKERIRATDIGQVIDWNAARPHWGWSPWQSLASVSTPTLFLVGGLEDPEDVMAEAARTMPNGARVRLEGLGHINAFLRSDLVLPQALDFLGDHGG